MDNINTNIFIDEVQIDKDENKNLVLSLYYLAVCINVYKGFIEEEIIKLLSKYNIKIFHAREIYNKPSLRLEVIRDISEIILKNNIKIICYNFRKKDLENPSFSAYKEVIFTDWQLPKGNYRAVSFYYFIHILNKLLPTLPNLKPKYKIIKHRDEWLEKGHGLKPMGNGNLNNIEEVLAFSTEYAPCLILADHLCYIFTKCRRELPVDSNGKIILKANGNQSKFLELCLEYFILFSKKGLFTYIDTYTLIS